MMHATQALQIRPQQTLATLGDRYDVVNLGGRSVASDVHALRVVCQERISQLPPSSVVPSLRCRPASIVVRLASLLLVLVTVAACDQLCAATMGTGMRDRISHRQGPIYRDMA